MRLNIVTVFIKFPKFYETTKKELLSCYNFVTFCVTGEWGKKMPSGKIVPNKKTNQRGTMGGLVAKSDAKRANLWMNRN